MPSTHVNPNGHTRVLIVEDDELQCQVLESVMTAAGFESETVGSGLGAVWKVREGGYDVVLIDYQLPDIDGLATAKLVGDFMGRDARPVLIGLTATPEHLNARENGAASAYDAILGKSSDFTALYAVITRCLASAPDIATRREAEFSLLLQDWLDYDSGPSHPAVLSDDTAAPRILVVEDDEMQQHLLTSVLSQHGYVVDTTPSGLDAVMKIRKGCYDLALVDYGLLEMDGLSAGTLIRDMMQEDKRPRLIALTATPGSLTARQAMAANVFDAVIKKSSDMEGLISSVDHHLRSSSNLNTRRAAASIPIAGG
jgi:CheY-like chemotaxis protein